MRKSVVGSIVVIMLIAIVIYRWTPQIWNWHMNTVEPFRAAVQASGVALWVGIVIAVIVGFLAIYWLSKHLQ